MDGKLLKLAGIMKDFLGKKKNKRKMKTIIDLNERKTPVVVIDETLNSLDDKIMFQEKLQKANKALEKIGLPKK